MPMVVVLLNLILKAGGFRAIPGWLLTSLSYVTLIVALICADLLLEGSAFR